MNWVGLYSLFRKEVMRFASVAVQTVFAPVVTALLYLLVFAQVMNTGLDGYEHISYGEFLIPGLIMMTVLQNAFANTSSSLIQSKMHGNLTFLLLSPISALEFFIAFVAASVVRGFFVGVGIYIVGVLFYGVTVHSWPLLLAFLVLSSALMGAMGLIAGLWADKYDHLAGFQNFVIMPLTFLSGVFYSIHSLPEFWQGVSQLNPFLYMVDGFRYAFYGKADMNVMFSLVFVAAFFVVLSLITLNLLKKGYKIRA